MKKLGFIRQKDKISQAEINSDKALFMDFWQYLEAHKKNIITRSVLLTYLMAVEGFSVNTVLKSKSLKDLFNAKNEKPKVVFESVIKSEVDNEPTFGQQNYTKEEIKGEFNELQGNMNKEDLLSFHQSFIQFARNRSSFYKICSMNKYKKREYFDDQIREKPNISKNSLTIAKKIREQIADQKMTLCEFRNISSERKKCDINIKSEDQIGGQAFHIIQTDRYKYKNKSLLSQWNHKEKLVNSKSRPNLNNLLKSETEVIGTFEKSAILDSIPEEGNNSEVRSRSPQGVGEKIPMLSIDVNFGVNMHDKITVFTGDNLKKLANEFTVKHNLSKALEGKLLNMLEEQVKSIL